MPRQDSSPFPPAERRRAKAPLGEQLKEGTTPAAREIRKPGPRLSAGHLSLDFVNTMHPRDFLRGPTDLIRWSREVGLVTEERAQALLAETDASPQESSALFTQAMMLREAGYRVLLALLHQTPPTSSDVSMLQSLFAQVKTHERLVFTEQRLMWQWDPAERGLTHLFWSLARATESVLTEPLMEQVKECPPSKGGCGWLFVDGTKNSSRQWCSDGACGSRIRMRRLYARKRANQVR